MIYVNARFLTQDLTGVQRFSLEVSKCLNKIKNNLIYLVPDISLIKHIIDLSDFKIIEVKGGNGHFWEQYTLPRYLRKNGSPLLLNLCNTAPILYSRQIVTHHDITYIKYPESFSYSFRTFYKTISPIIIKRSQAVITVSDFSKNEINTEYKCGLDKIYVIHNSVNDNFVDKDSNHKGDYILAVSSPAYHKNFHGLIRAFSHSDIDINLKIIGKAGSNFNNGNLDANDKRIDFMGRVDDEKLIELYQNAKAFIFPSFYEGFGIPVLEAQACGCPVVSSDKASMKEVLGDSALFFDPNSDVEIVERIKELLSNKNLRDELIEKGRNNLKRFSWENSAVKVSKIIDKCSELK